MKKRRKPTITPETWVVELDENHPDPGVAAKFADENARQFALDTFQRRLKRLLEKSATTPDELMMVGYLRSEIELVKADIDNHKEDE